MAEKIVGMKNKNTRKTKQKHGHAKPLIMRRKINSTVYEVAVHFSQTSRETLKDKILRMIRNEVW
jgi:hypothetical protein